MKRNSINYLYSFLLLLFIPLSAFSQQERKVAVFDPAGKVEEALLEIVREEISSVVVNTTGYTVLERQLINKVLEENKFQESGLVNDEQVSDIGKRMGADYVFVTTISTLGTNYYISCKMIEVSTARIDKQFTGTSTDGINDITQTTQYIVRRLFGENVQQPVVNKQPQQTDRPIQTTATQMDSALARQSADNYRIQRNTTPESRNFGSPANNRETSYYGRLVANKANVYSSGKALRYDEIRDIMANTDALKYYNKGIKKRKTGNILLMSGVSAFIAGTILTYAIPDETIYYQRKVNNVVVEEYSETEPSYGNMLGGGIVGLGCVIPGLILKSQAKRSIRQAVDVYNNSMYGYSDITSSFEIDFGFTSSGGIGFVMRF